MSTAKLFLFAIAMAAVFFVGVNARVAAIMTIMRSVVILDLRWLKCLLNSSPRPRFRNSLFNLVPKAFPLKNGWGGKRV